MAHRDKDKERAALEFFPRYLKHSKGDFAGRPFKLLEWQEDVVRKVFGLVRDDDGTRLIREVLIGVARKNGKTEFESGLGCKFTFADREAGAEVYSLASTREQAAICFDAGRSMIEQSEFLQGGAEIYRRAIRVPATNSSWKVLSSDVKGLHGYWSHATLVDEFHCHPTRDQYDAMKTSQGGRRQPITVSASTAGFDRNTICFEVWDYARKVRDGIVDDPSFLPVLFEAGPEDDWRDPATWRKANPSLGVITTEDFLSGECRRALESPGMENAFRRLYLNQWTEQDVRWLSMDVWKRNAFRADLRSLLGNECYAGLDLSSTKDYTALALVFPLPNGDFKLFVWFWIPEDKVVERRVKDRVPVQEWVRSGLVKTTPGATIEYAFIRKKINKLATMFRIQEIAIDRWNASELTQELDSDGLTVVPFGQGFKDMSDPSKAFEKLLLENRLHHGGNPVLQWMASNVCAKVDESDNVKPDKAKSRDRIDGIVAAIMAVGRAVLHGGGSVYQKRGLTVL